MKEPAIDNETNFVANSLIQGSSGPHFDEVVAHTDDAVTGYSCFAPSEANMKELIDQLFVQNWRQVMVGSCIEGAVFEALPAENTQAKGGS